MKKLTTYLSLFILLLALGACGGDNATGPDPDPDPDPTNGSVEVTTTTNGSDIDEDGYTVTVDGEGGESVESSDTITITNLEEGSHDLELIGVADNCTVEGDNPQSITITAGETASAGFDVMCSAASTNEVILTGDGGFGFHVQIDGTRAIVGAPGNDDNGQNAGAAYIYELQGDTWTQTAQLLASDGGPDDFFGHTVAIDGNRVLVSGHQVDTDVTNVGAAYVFELQGSTWVETQILSVGDNTNPDFNFARMGNQFGRALALDGNVMVIGAHNTDASGLSSGLVFIYELQNGTWEQTQQILPEDISEAFSSPPGGDRFGRGLDISGTTIVVGSPQDDDNGSSSGSAYIFEKQGNEWVETQKLLASDGASNDGFGFTLSIDSDRLVVGTGNNDDNGSNSGAVYVFDRQGGNWSETVIITPGDASSGAFFGFDAEVRGDVIVAGAIFDNTAAQNGGAAYVFELANGTWNETDKITASDAQANVHFGHGVGFTDTHIIIGASDIFPDIRSSTSGSAYIYERE